MSEVIIALDLPSRDAAVRIVDILGDSCGYYKVGLELYSREGPAMVRELKSRGKRVFLDLKLHDIPNTVAGAVRAVSEMGADLLTLHTLGGRTMMERAVEVAREAAEQSGREAPVGILGVTVLTSHSATDVEETWGHEVVSLRDEVVRLGKLALDSGIQGVVASVLEAKSLKRTLGQDMLVVTPGIRLAGGESDDQARVATPASAAKAGADYLVVGRPVTAAPDPRQAMQAVLNELGPLARVGGSEG
jgi:orotidine-5'-phosphate decarboxylase